MGSTHPAVRDGWVVLGIDPGTTATGIGLVRSVGPRLDLVRSAVLRVPSASPLPRRIARLCAGLDEILDEVRPDGVAVEGLFLARNVRSALTLAHLRGALLLTLERRGLDVAEYTPMQVKKAVTGHGAAAKDQVRRMVRHLLGAPDAHLPLDASDALAVAICHAHTAVGIARRLG